MNTRRHKIEEFLIGCCNSSSIYYDGKMPSVKYLRGRGTIIFFERSRMLDLVEIAIPDYNADTDESIIASIIRDSEKLMGCESHEYQGCHYTLTISLKE